MPVEALSPDFSSIDETRVSHYTLGRGSPVRDDIKRAALQDYANGEKRLNIAKAHHISEQSLYNWASDSALVKRLGVAESASALKASRYVNRSGKTRIENITDTVQTQKPGTRKNKSMNRASSPSSPPPCSSVNFCPNCGTDMRAMGVAIAAAQGQ